MKLLKKIGECCIYLTDVSVAVTPVLIKRPETELKIRAFGEDGNELHSEDLPERNEFHVRVPEIRDGYKVTLYVESEEENEPWQDYVTVQNL